MRNLKGQKGLSLVEVTIMLLVLMLLTSVLAPSIFDFVNDAKWVKVKEDCEAIGLSIARLTRDVGPCLRSDADDPCEIANRVDVLYSDGAVAGEGTGDAVVNANIETGDWNDPNANSGTMEAQLVLNSPGYRTPSSSTYFNGYPVGPQFNLGWRGAYLAPPIGPDPWGSRYYVNSGFLAVATNGTVTNDEGGPLKFWDRDVFCLSAGPDATIATLFRGSSTGNHGTVREGDDFVYVISGSTR